MFLYSEVKIRAKIVVLRVQLLLLSDVRSQMEFEKKFVLFSVQQNSITACCDLLNSIA